MTGDDRYEKMYRDILDIRKGKKPRPERSESIYWDLVLNYGDKPRPDGETKSLKSIMEDLGFTEDEFALLKEAQANSDGLVTTETIAMNAVKGLYDDGTGNYVKKGQPDAEMARRIMHDLQYHKDKARIMEPIDRFFVLLDDRTSATVASFTNRGHTLFTLVIALEALLVATALVGYRTIQKRVNAPVRGLMDLAGNMAKGDLSAGVGQHSRDEIGVLSKAMGEVTHRIRDVVTNISDNSEKMNTLSDDLVSVSQTLSGNAQSLARLADKNLGRSRSFSDLMVAISAKGAQSNANLESVTEAANEMNQDFATIAAAAEEATVNLSTVASAAERPTATNPYSGLETMSGRLHPRPKMSAPRYGPLPNRATRPAKKPPALCNWRPRPRQWSISWLHRQNRSGP